MAFSTGIKSVSNFNLEKQCFEEDAIFKLKLIDLKQKVYDIEKELVCEGRKFDAYHLKVLLLIKNSSKTLIEVLDEFITFYQSNNKLAKRTFETYFTRGNGLKSYLNLEIISDILIQNVSFEFVKKYENWLIDKKYSSSYCNKNTKYIAQLLRFSLEKKYIVKSSMDFYKYLKEPKIDSAFLSLLEVRKSETVEMPSNKLQKVKDWFLFQCYTGHAYIGLKNFNPQKNIILACGVEWIEGFTQLSNSFTKLRCYKKQKLF